MSGDETFSSEGEDEEYSYLKFDEAAFDLFFKLHFTSLCMHCQYKFNFDLNIAKEVVQAAFIKLWETRSTLSPNLSVKGYLYRIITNNSLDILKHEKFKQKHQEHVLQSALLNTNKREFEEVEIKQLSADIEEAIAHLPEQMRKIFELSRYEGLKYSAIAEHLNISVKTVETQMSRALAKLRHRLSEYLPLLIALIQLLKK